jgi:hypothetical protein
MVIGPVVTGHRAFCHRPLVLLSLATGPLGLLSLATGPPHTAADTAAHGRAAGICACFSDCLLQHQHTLEPIVRAAQQLLHKARLCSLAAFRQCTVQCQHTPEEVKALERGVHHAIAMADWKGQHKFPDKQNDCNRRQAKVPNSGLWYEPSPNLKQSGCLRMLHMERHCR